MRIAILGGTGPEGKGLATRLAIAGETVIIGSRSAGRAEDAAAEIVREVPGGEVRGAANEEAASEGEVVMISVPWEGLDDVFDACSEAMGGKVVIDLVVPLRKDGKVFRPESVAEGSAGEKIQARLPDARVVSAFKHQSAQELLATKRPVEGDVLLCGDDEKAKKLVTGLVRSIPALRPVDVGPLAVCQTLDAMTALILNINRKHKVRASFQVLGLEQE